ncbi:LOG family protein [Candidatus Pacearchaeota archaeon]|nr:LOG family protein [Candidatus Pacearchaeota archaeon]
MKIPKNDGEFEKLINDDHFRVAIFGSARVKRGDPRYKMVHELAKKIGERGIDIVTGGGPGIMEAANSGHKEGSKKSGAHSIGLGIKLPHEQVFNKAVGYKKTFNRFSSRLDNFMLLSNVVVVVSGGVGTLLELFYTWQLMQVKHVCNMPIILLGDMWSGLLKWLKNEPLKKGFFDKKDFHLLYHAKSYDEAIKFIDMAHKEFTKGNKDFCINYKKYSV